MQVLVVSANRDSARIFLARAPLCSYAQNSYCYSWITGGVNMHCLYQAGTGDVKQV
jgi:hypothetical protein